jgi:hypothetical protein
MLDALRDLGPDVYVALDARAVDLTGRPLHQLPDGELRACLEAMRVDLVAALSSDDLIASGVELAL